MLSTGGPGLIRALQADTCAYRFNLNEMDALRRLRGTSQGYICALGRGTAELALFTKLAGEVVCMTLFLLCRTSLAA